MRALSILNLQGGKGEVAKGQRKNGKKGSLLSQVSQSLRSSSEIEWNFKSLHYKLSGIIPDGNATVKSTVNIYKINENYVYYFYLIAGTKDAIVNCYSRFNHFNIQKKVTPAKTTVLPTGKVSNKTPIPSIPVHSLSVPPYLWTRWHFKPHQEPKQCRFTLLVFHKNTSI